MEELGGRYPEFSSNEAIRRIHIVSPQIPLFAAKSRGLIRAVRAAEEALVKARAPRCRIAVYS